VIPRYHDSQLRLRHRIAVLLADGGSCDAVDLRRVLLEEGWTRRQIATAREAIVESVRSASTGRFEWRLRPGARIEGESRRPRRELLRCTAPGCSRHIGLRKPGEPHLCLLCQETKAS
jgi:hypothetical protein